MNEGHVENIRIYSGYYVKQKYVEIIITCVDSLSSCQAHIMGL